MPAQQSPPIPSECLKKNPLIQSYLLVHSFLSALSTGPHRTAPPDDHVIAKSHSRMLSSPAPVSLPRGRSLLRCSFGQGTQPFPVLLRVPAPRPHPPRLSRKEQQGRPAFVPPEAYACTCAYAYAPIHLTPSTGRGDKRHCSSPPRYVVRGRVGERGVFKCFRYFRFMFQVFHHMLQTSI
jgi:hypothetical protein